MRWWIKKINLEAMLCRWNDEYDLYTPQKQYGEIMLLPYENNTVDLNYINFSQPVKEFLIKPKETLFDWEKNSHALMISKNRKHCKDKIVFGVRACDTNGIRYMDKFFLEEFCDDVYKTNRENTVIVAMNCVQVGDKCFCDSLNSGPFTEEGSDLTFTPIEDAFLIESNTVKGKLLLDLCFDLIEATTDETMLLMKNNILRDLRSLYKTRITAKDINQTLNSSYDDDIWEQLAEKCIRCGGCTNVCPTCTCFNVVEENRSSESGKRIRCLDSCQCDSFTRNAGGHKPRNAAARVRYRIYDKLKYIEDRFDHKGCTGCGRCITVCPVDIDIVKTINTLSDKMQDVQTDTIAEKDNFTIHQHKDCEQTYIPHIAVITEIIDETKGIKRFIMQYEDRKLHKTLEMEGQFFEITVFGVGEIAISIPFAPSQKDYFDFCVKNVGKVTEALHAMKPGDKVGLRGPFGKGFPYEEMKGRDVLIIGSGVGIAPVRTIIMRIAEERKQFGNVSIIGSALSYENLIYKQDFINWKCNHNMNVMYALSKSTEAVEAHVGYINDLLPGLDNDWSNTTAIICASPKRIKEVAKDLLKLGMQETEIYTSLETHMRCGIGKCGHCKVGNKYMCVDGPVFNYKEMLQLPPEF